jgi:putative ABC transport system substrate-binding protein
MNIAVANNAMSLVAIPIESARDISVRMHKFKDNVDMIYVGSSGAVQPALPTIVSLAEEMGIPVFNMNSEEVKEGRVFASYGVSFYKVGINASRIVANLLTGTNIKNLPPLHPLASDHEAFINKKRAEKIGFDLPKKMPGITFIEQ